MSHSPNPYAETSAPPNPYAPAVISSGDPTFASDSERIRRQHLAHEASIKSIGILFFLGVLSLFVGGIANIIAAISGATPPEMFVVALVVGVVCLVLSVLMLIVAVGFRKLAPWARIPGMIFAGIGMLAVPVGTIINGYILYLLASAKGKMVLSPEYRKIIFETPHIQCKTAVVVWILLGILGFVILLGILGGLVGAIS